jgi:hypothetical protein
MKNLRTFEEFINEELILEKKELSPANVKAYNANKNSVNALKKWTYKLKDIEAKFQDMEYFGQDSEFFEFINGKKQTVYYLTLNIGGIAIRTTISYSDNELKFEQNPANNRIYLEFKQLHFLQYVDENEDKVLGFIDLLNFLFKNFENEIYEFISAKISLQTLYVIDAGKIAPGTGKTGHGWSIYDYPNGVLGATKYGLMLWDAKGFKVGDKFKVLDDQTHKLVSNEVEIVDLIPATYKDFVNYCRQKGYEVPVAPFKKQTGSGRFTLYSIK